MASNTTLLQACCAFVAVVCVLGGIEAQNAPCYACMLFEYRRSQGRSQPYITPPPKVQPQHSTSNNPANLCAKTSCDCSTTKPPVCAEGILPVKDGCGCCTICPGQLNGACDAEKICDVSRKLHCHGGTCEGVSAEYHCFSDSKWYENGHRYKFGCDRECICSDGHFTCSPVCANERAAPNNCLNPRLIPVKGDCCKKWKCDNYFPDPLPATEKLEDSDDICESQEATPWSQCSTSCGWGEAKRFSSGRCQPEVSACIIRPCKEDQMSSDLNGGEDNSSLLQKVQIDECISEKVYHVRFCPRINSEGKCCQPSLTVNRRVKFLCPNDSRVKKSILFIKECVCGDQC